MPNDIPDLDKTPLEKPKSTNWPKVAFALGLITLLIGILIILGVQYFNKPNTQKSTMAQGESSVSGIFDINGPIPDGTTLSLTITDMQGSNAQVTVDLGLTASDKVSWHWDEAAEGHEYKIVGLLKKNNETLATSKPIVIIAPANGEVLTINNSNTTQNEGNAAISGSLDLNGYFPPNSTISIVARSLGSSSFKTVVNSVPAVDQGVWNWTTAELGTTYEIQAVLNGTPSTSSEIQEITAPATGEVMTLNSTLTTPAPTQVGISGTFNINGTVPSNSYISLATRVTGTTSFNQVATNLPATNGTTWSWNGAQSGTSYDIQAYIWSNGTPYTSSQIMTVTAPASNETITLNAMTPPSNTPPGNSISVSCNGANPANGLWSVNVSYNNNNAITNAQQYNLTIGNTGGGNQFINNTTTPSNPNQSQNYTTAYVFNAGQTYYAQYAYATCQNCNTFSNFSPSVQFSCSTPYATATPNPTNTPAPTTAPTNTPSPTPTN
jgi:hypothetical protein